VNNIGLYGIDFYEISTPFFSSTHVFASVKGVPCVLHSRFRMIQESEDGGIWVRCVNVLLNEHAVLRVHRIREPLDNM
jgi:hypothetical protein